MSIEQMEIPVAEMEVGNIECEPTQYAITPDGTVVEAQTLQENAESFQEAMQ